MFKDYDRAALTELQQQGSAEQNTRTGSKFTLKGSPSSTHDSRKQATNESLTIRWLENILGIWSRNKKLMLTGAQRTKNVSSAHSQAARRAANQSPAPSSLETRVLTAPAIMHRKVRLPSGKRRFISLEIDVLYCLCCNQAYPE